MNDGQYQKSQFNLIDLAGAERPDTTGAERSSGVMAYMKVMKGEPLNVGDQGALINFELTELLTCISQTTDAQAKGKKYIATAQTPPLICYIWYLINGASLMNMVICLSQAPQNG